MKKITIVFITLFLVFLLYQGIVFVVNGKNLFMVRNVAINIPDSYSDFRIIHMKIEPFLEAKDLVEDFSELSIAEDQKLTPYGITELRYKDTDEIYLYDSKLTDTNNPNLIYIYATSTSLKESPKGVYHPYKISPKKEKWVIVLAHNAFLINSDIPPMPSCFVNEQTGAIYYPEQLIQAAKVYYPNISIPEDRIINIE